MNTSIKRVDYAKVSQNLSSFIKHATRLANNALDQTKVTVAHASTLCIWPRLRFMEMFVLEIVTQLGSTLKKRVVVVWAAILPVPNAMAPITTNVLIVTMDLSV